jgi:hypothetical protein
MADIAVAVGLGQGNGPHFATQEPREHQMSKRHLLVASALAIVAHVASPSASWAAGKDYRFEVAGQPVKSGKDTVVKVKLVHAPDNKPITGAIILPPKADMGPEGMAEMTTPVKVLQATEPGVYQVSLEPGMAGKWALTLSAKVQGEPETVRGTVTVDLVK